jgi:uncharacterized protein (TIGR03118 family)
VIRIFFAGLILLTNTTGIVRGDSINAYVQTNLTSDLPGIASHQDPNLVNPWGIVAGPTTPFWINDNGTGLSTLYNGSGTPQSLVVNIPSPNVSSNPGAPTGIVFNSTPGFGGARFIFATEDGTITAWSSGTSASLQVTSPGGSVYKGLAIGNNGTGNFLYAANFGLNQIDVFDSSFHPAALSGGFTDPALPADYAPFNIENMDGKLYVTYALQDAGRHDDVPGSGHGYIDVYDLSGNLLQRFTSQGGLDSPWGLTRASSDFGAFSGDLLVGNFGDGKINAYDPVNGAFMGTLDDSAGLPIAIDGLWGLAFGNGAQGQDRNTLYFTAGIAGPDNIEDHGLFGSITTVPEPQPEFLIGGVGVFMLLILGFRSRLTSFLHAVITFFAQRA